MGTKSFIVFDESFFWEDPDFEAVGQNESAYAFYCALCENVTKKLAHEFENVEETPWHLLDFL